MRDPSPILVSPWREASSPANFLPCPVQVVNGDTLQSFEDGMQGGVVPRDLTDLREGREGAVRGRAGAPSALELQSPLSLQLPSWMKQVSRNLQKGKGKP